MPRGSNSEIFGEQGYVCIPFLSMLQGEDKAGKLPMRVSKGRQMPGLDGSEHKCYLECPPWGGRTQRNQNRTNREREDEWSLSQLGSAEQRETLSAGSEFLG